MARPESHPLRLADRLDSNGKSSALAAVHLVIAADVFEWPLLPAMYGGTLNPQKAFVVLMAL